MDHPCHKCGHSIEDGKAFCSQCGAPQIRVTTPETSSAPIASQGAVPAAMNETETGFSGIPIGPQDAPQSYALRPCALAAAVAVVLMFLGLSPLVAPLVAGFLATTFSQRHSLGIAIRPLMGARLGAFSGLLLFGITTIFETLAVVLLHKGAEIRAAILDKAQQAAARYPGPEVEPFLQFVKSPDGFALMMVASVIFGLVAALILGGLGGAIGVAFVRRRDRL
jgi:hypothetical protein